MNKKILLQPRARLVKKTKSNLVKGYLIRAKRHT